MMSCKQTVRRTTAIAACLMMAGCGGRGGPIAYNQTNFAPPDAPDPAQHVTDYRLSPGDVVDVEVYELKTVSGNATVDAAGNIRMPLIGPVTANGLAVAQLRDLVAKKLEKYLQAPHVAVSLVSAVERTVTVEGDVTTPGVYVITPDVTLIQALALAKGVTTASNARRVIVFRQIDGRREAAAFDLVAIRRGKAADPLIYPNDMVVVGESHAKAAFDVILRSVGLAGFFVAF